MFPSNNLPYSFFFKFFINYAGLNGTQNFNYGIRVKHLRNQTEKQHLYISACLAFSIAAMTLSHHASNSGSSC